jgi:hypothetical protein
MRIIVFIITALIQAAAAVLIFFMLLLGLNGFSERDAKPSLIFFIALGVLSPLVLSGLSAYAAKRIAEKKSLGGVAASALSVLGFSALGVAVLVGGFFAALVIASIMHDSK